MIGSTFSLAATLSLWPLCWVQSARNLSSTSDYLARSHFKSGLCHSWIWGWLSPHDGNQICPAPTYAAVQSAAVQCAAVLTNLLLSIAAVSPNEKLQPLLQLGCESVSMIARGSRWS